MKVSVDRLEAEVELVEWVTLCTASVKTTAADGHHVPARRISLFYRMSLVSAISQVLTTQRLDNWLAIYVAAVRIATTSLILAAILLVLAPDKVGITAWALIYGWPIHRADRNVLHAAGAANDAAPATASPTDHPSAAGGWPSQAAVKNSSHDWSENASLRLEVSLVSRTRTSLPVHATSTHSSPCISLKEDLRHDHDGPMYVPNSQRPPRSTAHRPPDNRRPICRFWHR